MPQSHDQGFACRTARRRAGSESSRPLGRAVRWLSFRRSSVVCGGKESKRVREVEKSAVVTEKESKRVREISMQEKAIMKGGSTRS